MSRVSRNFSISLSPKVLERVDAKALEVGLTRSATIEHALMHALASKGFPWPHPLPPGMEDVVPRRRR